MSLPGFTFRSTPFYAEGAGPWFSEPPPPERIEERAHIPYSAINIVDDAGDGLREWQVTIIVESANVAGMEANLGQTGSLVTPRGTYSNSKLSGLRSKAWSRDGALCRYEANFIAGLAA